MPFRPEYSILRVEVPALHTIDTTSVENLFGMWSLFSKTSHAMEDGKRLENLSWRLWNRETFCCEPRSQAHASHLSPRCSFSARPRAAATEIPVPELSSSLESSSSEEAEDEKTSSTPAISDTTPSTRPRLRRYVSTESRSTSRGIEKHITPVDLEKIVISIKETKELEPIELPMPTPSSSKAADPSSESTSRDRFLSTPSEQQTERPQSDSQTETPHQSSSRATLPESSASTLDTNNASTISSQTVGSPDSLSTEMSAHSIIRGFVPGGAPSSYRSQTHLASQPQPILKTSPQYQPNQQKKKAPVFTIGTSSGEDESSLDSHFRLPLTTSSLTKSLRDSDSNGSSKGKKQTSFKEEVAIGQAAARHSPVFESDDEDEDEDAVASESAIEDDDDSSDWEDSDDNSGPSSANEKELFQRVDSRPNLVSRRSLLTSLMHEPDRAKALANAASRSTPALRRSRTSTPNGPSCATSPEPHAQAHLQLPGHDRAQPKPIIMTTSNTHQQLALSPRTTRRNMLSTELTESLRKNLLWERQHKSTGNLAALKRRHTSQDVKTLKQHPEPGPVLSHDAEAKRKYTNDYFHAGLGEYHTKGW